MQRAAAPRARQASRAHAAGSPGTWKMIEIVRPLDSLFQYIRFF
ncbi:hypothetical protein [Rhizobium sp. CC-YZS058]|nr:hypothetical protein [Rhizobium sp. CC-YZS058]MEA3535740.1 hypothetical protein [Rhizobium sp. CC-YZS058]